MKGRAVNVTVTTEVGYCPFCRRTRTLRREERHLGALVRTNIDCESCHRNLTSTMGPAAAQPSETVAETAAEEPTAAEPAGAEAAPPATQPAKPTATRTRKPAGGTGPTTKKR